jgi:TolB-like protein
VSGTFGWVIRFLSGIEAFIFLLINLSNTHFAIASIVGLDDVSRTNKLGYLIQEHLVHELQVRGFKVVDFKLMSDQIQVTKDGDFVFSRDPKRLKKQYDIADVVSGTYSFQADGVVLNIRAVDTKTGVVTTSAQAYLPRTDYEHMMTGRAGVYHNGEYFYREQSDVRIVDRPVPYEGSHNTVKIVK